MRILLVHQNFPGQYRHLLRQLTDEGGHEIAFLCERPNENWPGIRKVVYKPHRAPHRNTHVYLHRLEDAVLHGQAVARVCLQLKKSGFTPDVMLGHNGWGETFYLKDVYPDTPLLGYFEFFYAGKDSDSDFDPEYPPDADTPMRVRTWNAGNLIGLEAADQGQTPTVWQRSRYPARYHNLIQVCHEGIDIDVVKPDPAATLPLASGKSLEAGDEVLTFVSRNLEPYRGFHVFMRALPELLRRRPKLQVVIVGADGVSYGRRLPPGESYKARLLAEVGTQFDMERVHFTGHLPYETYLRVLQVSRVHLYLTYPFVLSWSLMEAMAAGCLVVGSATSPVQEVIRDGENGQLIDFFDRDGLVETVTTALGAPEDKLAIREAARSSIVQAYDLHGICLPAYRKMVDHLADRKGAFS